MTRLDTSTHPSDPKPDDLALLIEVAMLYYEEGRTQAEIGRRVGTSRSTVSRLLQEGALSGRRADLG